MPRRRVVSRPALPRRAIVWFPPAAVVADVERFRRVHDPLAVALPAHVTIVFPFASALGQVQVAAHVRRAVSRWPALPVRLHGLGHFHFDWVHVKVTRGAEAVTALHDRLYRGALAPFLRRDLPYEPHLTIARAAEAATCDALLAQAAAMGLGAPRDAVLRTLTLCTLRADGTLATDEEFGIG
jgi:2'-5' RNA ligase